MRLESQDQLAAARGAIAGGEARPAEEQAPRRQSCSIEVDWKFETHCTPGSQDQLAAARGAIAGGESRLAEEQESRRQFLMQFQAKSKAALAERVVLEEQVRLSGVSRFKRGKVFQNTKPLRMVVSISCVLDRFISARCAVVLAGVLAQSRLQFAWRGPRHIPMEQRCADFGVTVC